MRCRKGRVLLWLGSSCIVCSRCARGRGDVLLQRVARSAEAQALIRICGTPRILGRFRYSSHVRYTTEFDIRAYSTAYIYYHRHDANSLRFYALGSNGTRLFDLQDKVLRSSLKHSFSHIASNTGQILVNQWNSAKSLEQFIEHEQHAQTINTQEVNARFKASSKFTAIDKKIQCTIDEIESSANLFWRVASFVFVHSREFSIVGQENCVACSVACNLFQMGT
ncbi:hypothetical protein CY34DRAFT_261635 [Suillus luteus UH-Slu-Lm8-n1]|uniref:Uncharacterized protein n=1 Tax=Suillus luteus UH-Slu-Lm8-n1 TaxID=930992 RepID=A0A0C9ZRY7_9AGAM|nr:hypothetical protein CY34DRAFT_261635 [Suillus luteus UH-Slu-Lm8-n1]